MKTITENGTNISIFTYNDDRTVTIGSASTTAGATASDKYESIEEQLYFGVTSGTHTLRTGVTEPSDWFPSKYKFDGSSWTKNAAFKIVCEKTCMFPNELLTLNAYDATTCSECGESL